LTEKRCNHCKRILPIDDFYKDKASKDGHKNNCKECQKEFTKAYRSKNYDKVMEYQATYREKNRSRQELERKSKYNALKTPCVKCGESRLYVIQFHHIDPKTKLFNITEGGSKYRNIEEESKKCVCLCSNCHDELHYFYGKLPKKPKESLSEYLGINFE
jgi:hypothetical protein